jgi:hypothetical protein
VVELVVTSRLRRDASNGVKVRVLSPGQSYLIGGYHEQFRKAFA